MRAFLRLTLAGAAALLVGSATSHAAPITFTGSSGALSASVIFDVVGGNLQVTLTNTAANPATMVPADVLTAVFFDVTGNPTLSRISAVLGTGAVTRNGAGIPGSGTDPGGVVGGEWAYTGGGGTLGSGVTQTQGISSSGLGIVGPPDRFPGSDLEPPASPDGIQYGIIGSGAYNPNPGLSANTVIQSSVVFTLGNIPGGFDPSTAISNIRFQYGTATSEPSFPGGGGPPPGVIPVPPSVALMALGGLGLALAGLRRRFAV